VAAAVSAGATLATRGGRDGATVEPTVLTDVPEDAKVMAEEVFGPVLSLNPVASVDEGFARMNASQISGCRRACSPTTCTRVRGVQPARRRRGADRGRAQLPGRPDALRRVKDSGVGREGPASAMEDLTEERVTVFTGLPF